jgi:hypothetical protein
MKKRFDKFEARRRNTEVNQVTAPDDLSGLFRAPERKLGRLLISKEPGWLSIRQRVEIIRRLHLLEEFDYLRAAGASQAEAVRLLRPAKVSLVSLWRWKKRIVPLTHKCGRKSALENLAVPAWAVLRVRTLRLRGMQNASAWRSFGRNADCPPDLAEFIRNARNIPPSFLRATRVIKNTTEVSLIE